MKDELSADVDLLTGAFKRGRLETELTLAVRAAKQQRRALSVLVLDVDDLQELNDLHGRDALDVALGHLAAKVSEVVDGKGPIGRVGGDELAVVLPGIGLDSARHLAERIRQAAPQTRHASAFGDFRLTVSVGVAALRASEPSLNLLEAAEAACLRVKQGGRDGVASR
ncbi:MAG: GGDEF domain-containing protein [Myxococcota bacterium]